MKKIKAKEYLRPGEKSYSEVCPSKGIRVYWWMSGSKDLYYTYVDTINYSKGAIDLADGGWMPLNHCYLTEEQALANPDKDFEIYKKPMVDEAIEILNNAKLALQNVVDNL